MEGYFQEDETGEIFMVLKFGLVAHDVCGDDDEKKVYYIDGLGGHFVMEERFFHENFTKVEDPT